MVGGTVLNQDFKEFPKSLNDSAVRYIVVGGYRVEIYSEIVDFIDLESLRKNKRASGQLQDLADLEKFE